MLFAACRNNTDNQNNSGSDDDKSNKSSMEKKETHADIHILAKPDSVAIDASKTAVIVVDMQNDFCSKGGLLDHGGVDISMIRKVIIPTSNVLDAARRAGIKIVYLKMGYSPDLSDIGSEESPNRMRELGFHVADTLTAPDGSKSRFLIRDTWNTEIISELKPHAEDIIINKNRFSGFYQTNLDSVLKKLGKKYLIVMGSTTSVCVESTVRDAMFRDYSSIVLEDCTAEPIGFNLQRSNYEASLFIIQTKFGWISTSKEFIKSLKTPQGTANQKLQ